MILFSLGSSRPKQRKGRLAQQSSRGRWEGLAFTLPAWLLLFSSVVIPIVIAIYLSVTDLQLTRVTSGGYIGFENFQEIVFTLSFLYNLGITLFFVAGAIVVQFFIGYFIAEALAQPIRAVPLFQTGLLIPLLMTPVAVGLMWRFLFNPDLGFIRWVLSPFVGGDPINFLGNVWFARGIIIGIDSWMNTPFVAILLLAGILGIPKEIYEAASIDGASARQVRLRLTIPLLKPVILVTLALRFIATFRLFDMIYTVTRGGPGVATQNLSMVAFQEGFTFMNIGRGAAIAVAMAVLSMPAYWFFSHILEKDS